MANRHPQLSPRPSDTSSIEIHQGEVLMRLANTYVKLPQTILECIQNGFDAQADRVLVCIDMKQRRVIVLDNGLGTDRTMFESALASVGRSVKDKNSLGRFGLGLISPLSKCSNFTFTSAPAGQRKPTQWTFEAADIKLQQGSMVIPCKTLEQMPSLPRKFREYLEGEFAVAYRTMVQMNDVVLDRAISQIDLDELAYDIRTKFMVPMRQRKALVRMVYFDVNGVLQTQDVNPLQYDGEPLPEVSFPDQGAAGRVEFELYRARRVAGRRQGRVSVTTMGNDTPLTWVQFTQQMRGRYGSAFSDAIQALGSGYFEGIIRCENVALAPSRTKFELGEALDDLYLTIDEWFLQHGRALYTSEADQSRHERWQTSALNVLGRLHDRLRKPEYTSLWENLRDIVQLGRLGGGHVEPGKGKLDGDESDPTVRVGQGGQGKPRDHTKPSEPRGPRQEDPKDRPGDIPFTVSGPRGNRRRLVKGDSQGLQIDFVELPGDSRLWGFDAVAGILTFNTVHHVWSGLDETNGRHTARNARWIEQLQLWLALQVLQLLLHYPDPDEFERHRGFVDDQIKHYVDLFIVGDTVRK